MHWRGKEQLCSVQFHFFEFSAAFAPFEVLSPQDFECQRQKNLSAFQWLRHRSLFTNANFVLDMSYHSFYFNFNLNWKCDQQKMVFAWSSSYFVIRLWCVNEVPPWSVGTQFLLRLLVVDCWLFMVPRCWLWFFLPIVIVDRDCLLLIAATSGGNGGSRPGGREEQRPQRPGEGLQRIGGFGAKVLPNFLPDPCPVRPELSEFASFTGSLVSKILSAKNCR